MRQILRIMLVCVVVSVIAGCGESENDRQLRKFIAEVKNRPPYPVEPLPKLKPLPKFVYPDVHRRDPFKPIHKTSAADQVGPDLERKKEPLEAFPLDSLKVVGILRDDTIGPWALVLAPDEVVYRITVGDHVGQHFGQVKSIGDSIIRLEETMRIADRWEKRKAIMKLFDKE